MLRTRSRVTAVALTSAAATALLFASPYAAGAAPSSPVPAVGGSSLDVISASTPGLTSLLANGTTGDLGIATFDAVPTAAQVTALQALGLTVQPMKRLPLALVKGTVAQLQSAVAAGVAGDVYPNETLEYHDTASSDAMGAAATRAAGLTGKGVTVGIVDSGCDGTHPDLKDHITHNVVLVSGEYANQQPDSSNTLVVPMDQGPYSNTDLGSGHGTHVAGIVAADSSSAPDGSRLGVAPDAELACFAIGAVITTTAVVTAYDYMLDQPDMLGIDVVNNSWGNSYRQFDPRDPMHVASKAVTEQGAFVVFSAGNAGGSDQELTLNPFSLAPWVTSVAAGTIDHHRGSFSSNGLRFDNSTGTAPGAGGHTVFLGDRVGNNAPDITAPGVSISSSCSSTGTVINCGTTPGGNANASGTSMSSPHIAGAAAVLKQANPALTHEQLRQALQATATPVANPTNDGSLGMWQVGYGHAELDDAVALVSGKGWEKRLARSFKAASARVLAEDGTTVLRSDVFAYDSQRLAAGGSDLHAYTVPVGDGATRLRTSVKHPRAEVENGYTVTVKDTAGTVVGTASSGPVGGLSTVTVDLDLAALGLGAGDYVVEVAADLAVSDPDTIDSDSVAGRMVTTHVVQLANG